MCHCEEDFSPTKQSPEKMVESLQSVWGFLTSFFALRAKNLRSE